MSDWVTSGARTDEKYPGACASGAVRAGNDLMMPGGPSDFEDLMNSLDNPQAKYEITREDLKRCAGRIIRAVKAG